MPQSPVFSKLVRCPQQPGPVKEAGADHDACSSVASPKDESAYCDRCRADQRIDEEYLLLMRTKIIGFSRDDDSRHHETQQNSKRKGKKKRLSKQKL